MSHSPLEAVVLFHLGLVPISRTVATTWVLMAALTAGCWIATRAFEVVAGDWQTVIETVVLGIDEQIQSILSRDASPFLPLLGTLFIFLVVANLSGIVPGVRAPTASIETPAALASVVFISVHFYGVRLQGAVPYLKSYLRPNPVLLRSLLGDQLQRVVENGERRQAQKIHLQQAHLFNGHHVEGGDDFVVLGFVQRD